MKFTVAGSARPLLPAPATRQLERLRLAETARLASVGLGLGPRVGFLRKAKPALRVATTRPVEARCAAQQGLLFRLREDGRRHYIRDHSSNTPGTVTVLVRIPGRRRRRFPESEGALASFERATPPLARWKRHEEASFAVRGRPTDPAWRFQQR